MSGAVPDPPGHDPGRDPTTRGDAPGDFRHVFEQHYQAVHRYFEKRGFRGDEALDLTQETFLRAYRGWATFRGESSTATWIYRIAANTYYKELRRRGADKRSAHEVSLSAADDDGLGGLLAAIGDPRAHDPLDAAVRREQLRRLAGAFAELPNQMRTCLQLQLERGMANRDIAELLRVSPQTVKAHLFQARRRLKAAIADPDPPGETTG